MGLGVRPRDRSEFETIYLNLDAGSTSRFHVTTNYWQPKSCPECRPTLTDDG
jgi:hypothetical protein